MQDSVYYSTPQSFYREYIKVIADKNKTAPQILSTFRERKLIPKEFATVTARQLAEDPEYCERLVRVLRARMEPESPKFPYANYKKERAQELIDDLAAMYKYWGVKVVDAKADIVIGSWPPNRKVNNTRYNAQIFNYRLEVAFVPFANTENTSKIIGCINSVPGLDYGESYFDGGSYRVETKGRGYIRIKEVLEIS